MKTRKTSPQSTPAQAESFGACASADFKNTHIDTAALAILREFDAANKRKADRLLAEANEAAGGSPPRTNRGEKGDQGRSTVKLVLEDGVVKEITQRRGWGGDTAFIDWVNFTIGEETLGEDTIRNVCRVGYDDNGEIDEIYEENAVPVTDMQVQLSMSRHLINIFGFGITSQRKNGANFYQTSWTLGDGWGMVCHGGQRGTILVMLSGEGCAAAKPGWELRLKTFLENSKRARISRVDLAHDDYTGTTYSVDRADQEHTDGLFHIHGRNPDCEHRGNWKNPNGKGRTLNIGNRSNGKFCRVYEKGRQLGDKSSNWVRIEVEFKGKDRIIPFDVLLRPGEYLAAAYPAFGWINLAQERIFTSQKVTEASIEKAKAWIKHQCGSSLKWLRDILGDEEFFKELLRDGDPKWAKVAHYLNAPKNINDFKQAITPVDFNRPAFC